MATYSMLMLPDGAKLAYEVLGSHHLGRSQPIVLICGMSSTRVGFERLTQCLVRSRPVLIYDHRGIGNPSLSLTGDKISIERLAHDLLALLVHLKWKEVVLCGMIAQQMLLFPYYTLKPATNSFRVTHLILVGTRSVVTSNAGLRINTPAPNTTRTPEERKAIARKVVSSFVDPAWIEANSEQFEALFKRATNPNISSGLKGPW